MSTKVHTQVEKPESSIQASARSPALLRQRTALLDPDDSKRTVLRGYNEIPKNAPAVPDNPNLGHSFAHIPVFSPTRAIIQPKLSINKPNDIYEQEADRVADAVMRMPEAVLQRKSPCLSGASSCEEEEALVQTKPLVTSPFVQRQMEEEEKEGKMLQTKEVSGQTAEVAPKIEARINTMSGGGQPLPESVHAYYEPRFGYDFSQVRVHADLPAAESAQAVNAHAFTIGQHIVFGAGAYEPRTEAGRRLLAHELTHVVQQNQDRRNVSPSTLYRTPDKESPGAKKVYEALFVKPPSKGTCKKWRDKPTKESPDTTGKELVDKFRVNLKKHLEKNPMAVRGEVGVNIDEADVDRIAAGVNKKIIEKFGGHIGSPLSDKDIAKRVDILPSKKTMEPEFVKQWMANRVLMWTSIADYCVDEGDTRFQKVIDDILADSEMAKDIRIMASRQSAFIESDKMTRTVYIHRGAEESLAESILAHEIVHFYAHKDYLAWNAKMVAPRFVNEGFTEFLAREVMSGARESYKERFEFIRDEVAKYVTVDDIAAAFFAGKVWQVENVSKVAAKLFKEFTEREKVKEQGK